MGGMLNLDRCTGSPQPGSFTDNRLFKPQAPSKGPKPHLPMTSGGRKEPCKESVVNSKGKGKDDGNDEDRGDRGDVPRTLPPLLTNPALVKAVSETQMAAVIAEWKGNQELHEILKLLSVLVEPPLNLGLDMIEGLPDYLTGVHDWLMRLPDNGICSISNHCWWIISSVFIGFVPMQTSSYVLTGLCDGTGKCTKCTKWNSILASLEKSQKRIINWCPTIVFLDRKEIQPKDRRALCSMLNMCFNPDPSLRLRIVPFEGV
jgi:hypothetical protein